MWEIVFYEAPSGDCPMDEFLQELHPATELPYVRHKLELLEEHGYKLQRPHAAPLEQGIYELRVFVNKRQIRCLYFFYHKVQIVFTHGMIKKGNTKNKDAMPPIDIARAIAAREDYRKRNP